MLLTYFLNVFEIVPVAPIITGITFVFTFQMRCISIIIIIITILNVFYPMGTDVPVTGGKVAEV